MKGIFLTISACLIVFSGFISASSDNKAGKAGATGSPGENTCSQSGCHTGFANNSMGGLVTISHDIPESGYVLGEQYNLSVTVSEEGITLFGFGFEALTTEGENAGDLAPGDGSQIKNATVLGVNRRNIVHIQNGGASTSSHTFDFTWTAPLQNEGPVTFYAAGNAANANGGKTGDHIYNTSLVVESDGSVGIKEKIGKIGSLVVYPNPVENELSVRVNLPKAGQLICEAISAQGFVNQMILNEHTQIGENILTLDISGLAPGPYLLVVKCGSFRQVRQITKI